MMNDHDKLNVEKFLLSISPWEAAYVHANFNFIAIKKNGVMNIIFSRIYLNSMPLLKVLRKKFDTEHILAGHFLISDLGLTYSELIKQFTETGRIKTPFGELILPVEDERSITTYFAPLHQDGINNGKRLSYLRFSGENRYSYIQQPHIDWELKAAPEPFDSLADLMQEL